ncbi:MAG: DUF952 domain-containing protein [Chitinophagaceae bacterium]
MEQIIYHITTQTEWENALTTGEYAAPSLSIEGFIHCSLQNQVAGVLQRYYQGKNNLILLTIDTSLLTNKCIFELALSVNQLFPHIYGTINTNAVIKTEAINA